MKAWLPVVSYRHGIMEAETVSITAERRITGKLRVNRGPGLGHCRVYNVLDVDRARLARGTGLSYG